MLENPRAAQLGIIIPIVLIVLTVIGLFIIDHARGITLFSSL